MQSTWNRWQHGNARSTSSFSKPHKQTRQIVSIAARVASVIDSDEEVPDTVSSDVMSSDVTVDDGALYFIVGRRVICMRFSPLLAASPICSDNSQSACNKLLPDDVKQDEPFHCMVSCKDLSKASSQGVYSMCSNSQPSDHRPCHSYRTDPYHRILHYQIQNILYQ